jgi:hypothetical protein
MPKTKKNIKVRDLKPRKDAKGGGGFKPTGAAADGRGTAAQGGTAPQGSTNPN